MFCFADHLLERDTAVRKTLTLVSLKTGKSYTYKFVRPGGESHKRPWLIKLLHGPDNERDFLYIGCLFPLERGIPLDGAVTPFKHTAKSKIPKDAPAWAAFDWFNRKVNIEGLDPADASLALWHEGRCGRCGRKLTTEASIASGIGPVCAAKGGA